MTWEIGRKGEFKGMIYLIDWIFNYLLIDWTFNLNVQSISNQFNVQSIEHSINCQSIENTILILNQSTITIEYSITFNY